MKKVFAALLVAAMAVSFAACNGSGNSENNSSTGNSDSGSAAAQESGSAFQSIEADPKTAEAVSKYIDSEKLGPKTQTMLKVLESKSIKISLSTEIDLNSLFALSTGSSAQSSLSSEEESANKTPLTLSFARSGDDNVAVSFGLSSSGLNLGLGIVSNKDGAFIVNDSAKQYAKGDSSSEESSESSSESLDKTTIDSTLDQFGLSGDSLKDSIPKPEITYNGETSEEFSGSAYSCESYTIKNSSDSSSSSEEAEVTFKIYFDNETPKAISASSDGKSYDVKIDTFTIDVSESDFTVPSEYTEVTSEELFSSLLGGMMPTMDFDTTEDGSGIAAIEESASLTTA